MGDVEPDSQYPLAVYLYRLTHRPGWSIQRLADESDLRRQTISNYINKPETAIGIKVETLVALARAAGDHPVNAFMAAIGLVEEQPEDREIGLIVQSDLPDDEKHRQIANIQKKREQDTERRIEDTQEILRILSSKVA